MVASSRNNKKEFVEDCNRRYFNDKCLLLLSAAVQDQTFFFGTRNFSPDIEFQNGRCVNSHFACLSDITCPGGVV